MVLTGAMRAPFAVCQCLVFQSLCPRKFRGIPLPETAKGPIKGQWSSPVSQIRQSGQIAPTEVQAIFTPSVPWFSEPGRSSE